MYVQFSTIKSFTVEPFYKGHLGTSRGVLYLNGDILYLEIILIHKDILLGQ